MNTNDLSALFFLLLPRIPKSVCRVIEVKKERKETYNFSVLRYNIADRMYQKGREIRQRFHGEVATLMRKE
jgi:hypothetical protein